MKISAIISTLKSGSTRALYKVKAHSPEILLAVGVGGIIGGTVLACRATLKAHTILEEAKTGYDEIHKCESDETLADRYTEEDARTDKMNLAVKTIVRLTGLYAPSVLLCGCSIACILLSHKIMSDQKAAAIAFGNAMAAALADYRTKVAEKFGKEAEESVRYGLKEVKSTDPVLYSDTDGSGKPPETEETCVELGNASRYAIIIDDSCGIWDSSSDMTLLNLNSALRSLNDTLAARATPTRPGYLFLREVYELLEVPRDRWVKEASMIGWLYDENNSTYHNFIDFGNMYTLRPEETENGRRYIRDEGMGLRDRVILVDLNIDGVIYDKI